MQRLDAAVLIGIPLEFVVGPFLFHPHVGRHDLVLQVLRCETKKKDAKKKRKEEKKNGQVAAALTDATTTWLSTPTTATSARRLIDGRRR